MNLQATLCNAALLALLAGTAHAQIVEPFTGGQLTDPNWSMPIGGDASSYLSTPAPDGSYGIYLTDSTWSYNTTLSFAPGQTLSAWINPGPSGSVVDGASGGRLYLGFAADATGAYSFVAASDTNTLGFQNNTGYGFVEGSSNSQTWNDQWYRLAISWAVDGQSATANLYDVDGTTLLSSVTETGLTRSATGLALYGNGGAVVTSLEVTPVPEANSVVLILAGLGLVGLLSARRRV